MGATEIRTPHPVIGPRDTIDGDPHFSLTNVNTFGLANGTLVWVNNPSPGKLFRLDRFSVAPPNGTTIIAPSAGPGRWNFVTGGGGDQGNAVISFSARFVSGKSARFLEPYSGSRILAPTVAVQILAPRAGTLRNLFVRHRVAGSNSMLITYTLRLAGVGTPLSVSLASNDPALEAANVAASVPVPQGALLDLRVTKAASVLLGPRDIFVTMEFAPP